MDGFCWVSEHWMHGSLSSIAPGRGLAAYKASVELTELKHHGAILGRQGARLLVWLTLLHRGPRGSGD